MRGHAGVGAQVRLGGWGSSPSYRYRPGPGCPRTATASHLVQTRRMVYTSHTDLRSKQPGLQASPAPAPTPSPSILFRSGARPCRSGNSSSPARQGPSDELGPFQGVGSRAGLEGQRARSSPSNRTSSLEFGLVSATRGLHATPRRRRAACLHGHIWQASRHEPLLNGKRLYRGEQVQGWKRRCRGKKKAMAGGVFGVHRAQP